MKRPEIAKRVAYVPIAGVDFPFSVLAMVTMGRTAHLSIFAPPSRREEDAAFDAMEELESPLWRAALHRDKRREGSWFS
jgi:iron complex transport system ATP-binding protein